MVNVIECTETRTEYHIITTGMGDNPVDFLLGGDGSTISQFGDLAAPPSTYFSRPSGVLMEDGETIMICGGRIDTGYTSECQFYPLNGDPAWTIASPMKTERLQFTMILRDDGKVWAIGGIGELSLFRS